MMNGFLKRAAACMLAVSMLVLSACSGGMQPGGSSLPDRKPATASPWDVT